MYSQYFLYSTFPPLARQNAERAARNLSMSPERARRRSGCFSFSRLFLSVYVAVLKESERYGDT
ncbi:UNVERIFIED_CONTAM: hypothetical protein FKN15_057558 [Acipenser sinensis]